MKFKYEIEHVDQPTGYSCVSACIAMITGLDVHTIIDIATEKTRKDVSTQGMNTEEEFHVLKFLGVRFVMQRFTHLNWGCVYIATVPSLNISGVSHRLIIDMRNDEYTVIDSNKGREGVLSYPDDHELKSWSELFRIEDRA